MGGAVLTLHYLVTFFSDDSLIINTCRFVCGIGIIQEHRKKVPQRQAHMSVDSENSVTYRWGKAGLPPAGRMRLQRVPSGGWGDVARLFDLVTNTKLVTSLELSKGQM